MKLAGHICVVVLAVTSILYPSPTTAHDMRQRFDGWFNNLGSPSWGSAGEDILFNVAPAYSDMTYQLAGVDRPNPRVVSNKVFTGPTGLRSFRNHTALFAFFGQMVSYEVVDATDGMCPLEMVKVPVPKNDSQFGTDGVTDDYMPFVRSAYNRETGNSPNNPRRPINRASSWLDASFVYGPGEVWSNCLREFTEGRLLTTDHLGYYPEYNRLHLPLDNLPDPISHEKMQPEKQWGFGDAHTHQNPGLMAIALVWFRYHNHVAARLSNSHPAKADERWSNEQWKDEKIFQAARRHVIAVMQNIIAYEYLPALLNRSLTEYKGYNPHLQPTMSAIFEAAAIRTYHTQIPPGIYVRGHNCSFYQCHSGKAIRMCNAYFRSQEMVKKYGLTDIIRGMASQIAEREDHIIVDDLRGRNYGPLQYSRQDLVVQTIMRGRDHGLPDYNTARKAFHLPPVHTWRDINPTLNDNNPEVMKKLADTYKDISLLDIYVGGLLEMTDGLPGPLFTAVILEQFQRIRDGDRFWFENKENNLLSEPEVEHIKTIRFSDVIQAATDLPQHDFQKDVFFWNEGDPCGQLRQLVEGDMNECTRYSHYDFFSGSEVSYIGSLIAVGLLPFLCILVAYLIAKYKTYTVERETKRYQAKMAVRRTPTAPGDIEALEWINKDIRTPIELHLDTLQCTLVVTSSKHQLPRFIKFTADNDTIDVWMSNDKQNNVLLIRVPKEHDLVIIFNADYERTAFVSNVRRMLTSHKMVLQVFESSQRDIIKNAVTRHKRNHLLTKFFKSVFAESYNVGELKPAEDLEIHECKDIVNCELSREEFADSLAMKPDSMFISQMFSLIDHDRNGYISFREFLYAVVLFSKGGPEHKIQLLFHMYDLDKSGTLDKVEVTALIKSMLEMAHSDLTSAETDQLVEKMFVTAELDKHGVLTLEDFMKVMAGEQNMMWDVCLDWKGMHKAKCTKRKSSNEKKSQNGMSQKTEPVNWDKGHRINFSGMTHPETAASSRFGRMVESVRNYIENYRQHIVCLLLFFGINFLVFAHKFYYYSIEQEHRGFRSVGGYWVSLSRGGAAGMSFSFSFILLTMCRNLITKLRETVLNQYLPFDAHVTFHIIVAYTAFFFMFLHVFGYCLIFYEVSTQPAEFLCIFREVSLSSTFLPKFHYWLFGTLPGATGVLLIAVICIMYIFAQPLVRTYIFNAFWVSHKLFYLLYVLTLLHGCVRLLQEPNFSYYFAGPAILFTLDKIVSLSRRKRELTILRMEQLPSDITYIEFKRPANFEYKSGQWVRLACTALGQEEYHSLTLTSAPHENTLSVYVLACGPWSWNLRRIADSQNQGTEPYPKLYIDGPFGSGHQDWYNYEVTILIGGGIGVTPYASILKEFVHMSTINSMYRMKCRKVYFVWVAGNQRHYEWMADVLRQIESIDTKEMVETHLFITQLFQNFDLRTTMLYMCEEHFQNMAGNSLFTGLKGKTHFGRPNFEMLFQAISDKHPKVNKVGVFSCGPAGLTRSIVNACNSVSKFTRTRFPHFYENF